MAKGPQYNLPFRRRRTGRTHYGKRQKLIASGNTRFVVRPSNKHLAAQVVQAKPDGDLIIASAHSSELKEFGWKAPCGNLPAAYLTGLLAGKRAKANGTSDAILDIGLHARDAGSRLFAAAKGAIDAGLVIPHDEAILPKKERIQGKHIGDYSKSMASEVERQKKMFAGYLQHKLKPEDLPTHFTEVESKIKSTIKETEK
ncbi:MAG TPA: 50S ribosomal protein L18 [Candidatus Acidoferrales bacterium]|nr:50S ribosomal protein L18 [Candidatus Acidoferrales bacterium]